MAPQVGFTRLAALDSAQLGRARVAVSSTSSLESQKTWMPGSADKFTKSTNAREGRSDADFRASGSHDQTLLKRRARLHRSAIERSARRVASRPSERPCTYKIAIADSARSMSALPYFADSGRTSREVREVPKPALSRCSNIGARKAGLLNHRVGAGEQRRGI